MRSHHQGLLTCDYFNSPNDDIASANEFRESTSISGHATDEDQMIDDLFNFDQNNEDIEVAPMVALAPVHENPSSRLLRVAFIFTYHYYSMS